LTFNSKLQVLGVAKINLKLLVVIFTAIAGFTALFLRVFAILAIIGRIPGTFFLSLKGAYMF
jgi:hypothetical protein